MSKEKRILNGLGITETKVAVLDRLIKFTKSNNGFIRTNELEYIKEELIKQGKVRE